jgi:hypothetical protein
MSEDTLPQADTLVRTPRSANDPAAAQLDDDDEQLDGNIDTLPQANWKGTGVLYRIFSAEVARENNLDADWEAVEIEVLGRDEWFLGLV